MAYSAKARENYAASSPVTRQSGKKKTVMARFIRNDRLADALHRQAQSALRASPGARAFCDEQRDRGLDHNAALRALSNRLVKGQARRRAANLRSRPGTYQADGEGCFSDSAGTSLSASSGSG